MRIGITELVVSSRNLIHNRCYFATSEKDKIFVLTGDASILAHYNEIAHRLWRGILDASENSTDVWSRRLTYFAAFLNPRSRFRSGSGG